MRLGMIGLGRMGANMVRRLLKNGHECVVFDRSPDAVHDLVKEKATGATSLPLLRDPHRRWLSQAFHLHYPYLTNPPSLSCPSTI